MAVKRADLIKRAQEWQIKRYTDLRGYEYRPFLKIRDVPSLGLRQRITSWTVGRAHHLLSKVEADFFYLFDANPSVTDIREQFPLLPVAEVQNIAKSLNVRYSYRKQLHVYTTDFLVTQYGQDIAVSVKPDSGKLTKRDIQKLLVEREYWRRRGIRFVLATSADLPVDVVESVKRVHLFRHYTFPFCKTVLDKVRNELYGALVIEQRPVSLVCCLVDRANQLNSGTSLAIVKHALANELWRLAEGAFFHPDHRLELADG